MWSRSFVSKLLVSPQRRSAGFSSREIRVSKIVGQGQRTGGKKYLLVARHASSAYPSCSYQACEFIARRNHIELIFFGPSVPRASKSVVAVKDVPGGDRGSKRSERSQRFVDVAVGRNGSTGIGRRFGVRGGPAPTTVKIDSRGHGTPLDRMCAVGTQALEHQIQVSPQRQRNAFAGPGHSTRCWSRRTDERGAGDARFEVVITGRFARRL